MIELESGIPGEKEKKKSSQNLKNNVQESASSLEWKSDNIDLCDVSPARSKPRSSERHDVDEISVNP